MCPYLHRVARQLIHRSRCKSYQTKTSWLDTATEMRVVDKGQGVRIILEQLFDIIIVVIGLTDKQTIIVRAWPSRSSFDLLLLRDITSASRLVLIGLLISPDF